MFTRITFKEIQAHFVNVYRMQIKKKKKNNGNTSLQGEVLLIFLPIDLESWLEIFIFILFHFFIHTSGISVHLFKCFCNSFDSL